jgi:drug/metabolite transporter (DMT)-like permease
MYYISAFVAVLGAVGYQYFVKQIPESINPIISVLGIYISALVLGLVLLPFLPPEGGVIKHIKKINWTQLAVAGSVILLELGFLLMYRSGWNLSIGNLVTGVFVNIILVGLGVWLLGEKVTLINGIGAILSIIGVALLSFRA